MMTGMQKTEKLYERALSAVVGAPAITWRPSPITDGYVDMLVDVPELGVFYGGSYVLKDDGRAHGEIVIPFWGTFPAEDALAWRLRAVERVAEWWEEGPSISRNPKVIKKLVADWKRWQGYVTEAKAKETRLRELPHPFKWKADEGLTLWDYVRYLLVGDARAAWKRAVDEVRKVR